MLVHQLLRTPSSASDYLTLHPILFTDFDEIDIEGWNYLYGTIYLLLIQYLRFNKFITLKSKLFETFSTLVKYFIIFSIECSIFF